MGFLRLLLAVLVLTAHLNIDLYGYHMGVMAVVIFYLLAGQVVARLWFQVQGQPRALLLFARDRLLRIFPQYWAALALAVLLWLAGAQSWALSGAPTLSAWLANLLILPLNFYMFTGVDGFTMIPPAWSLAAELQFYLLAPLLLGLGAGWQRLCLLLSLLVYGLAQLQLLHPDHFGYRLLPGVLFIFLLGSVYTRGAPLYAADRPRQLLWGLGWLLLTGYAAGLLLSGDRVHFRVEVAVGLVLGMPLLLLVRRVRFRHHWLWLLDRRAGELSYGVFLYHFPAIWMLQLLGRPDTGSAALPAVLAISLLLALAGHWLIERPLWRLLRPRLYS